MSHSTSLNVSQPFPAQRRSIALVALWSAQVVLAAMFLVAGGSKLAGSPEMVALFDTVGVGQWFRYVTGGIEILSAAALLVPKLAAFGAVALVPTMIGAIATHPPFGHCLPLPLSPTVC